VSITAVSIATRLRAALSASARAAAIASTGVEVDEEEAMAGKGAILATPGDRVKRRRAGDASHTDGGGNGLFNTETRRRGDTGAGEGPRAVLARIPRNRSLWT
jgi:hypothetical protein